MQIEIVEMEDTRAKFILKNSSPAMANALRRTMLQDIPKMAIDKVDFHLGPIMQDDKEYESVTSLFDEIIAHRLGLVPVPTTDQFTFQKDCSCGGVGCPGCSIMYSLNKVGPGTVLSGDLLPLGDSTLKVKDEFIPIVELTDSQAVLIYATAVMGTAKQHVKWQAAFGVGYSYMPAIEIDAAKAADSDVRDYAVKTYPGLFKAEDGKLVVDDIYRASRYGKAIQQDPVLQDVVSIDWDDSNFIFKFETDGSLTAQQVLDKAVEILEATASEFTAAVEAL
ncbi:MAG: DNA-directed RNA polymerase subunit D [Candidatus Methanomethylophilus sp.]|nr:DNA-directed RNA polymerase subunit D [Methanomethylophilus sp.]MBQ4368470.1 DNA-directed RNA polymerase subunit D [Methanomethylophilus sp.]MBQ5397341.1 DNA-directed RNA polymerase subunit D [Methanomethylophilus sp.]MBQ5447533.1 DNA-directed RNA polymerase subunit D [Methanomethylophilus sp.]